MRTSNALHRLIFAGLMLVLPGCIGFGGPNDVRKAIAERENVVLDKEMGVTVGPLGVFLANTIAGRFLPMDMNGIDWVSYGEYTARCNGPSAERVCLRDLDLPGWERIARICDHREDVLVMVPDEGRSVRKLLLVMREDETVRIVRAEGDLEKVLDRVLESDLLDDDLAGFLSAGAGNLKHAEHKECAKDGDRAEPRPDRTGPPGIAQLSPDQRRRLDQHMRHLGWLNGRLALARSPAHVDR